MPKNKLLSILIMSMSVLLLLCTHLYAEELLSDQDLLQEPKRKSPVAGKAVKGTVSVIEKKGFWLKIKSVDVVGWTKRSNVKAVSSLGSLASIDTGRSASGNIVSTSSVRGLDGNDLINASPNFKEFEKLEGQRVSQKKAVKFAKVGGLSAKEIGYIEAVQGTNDEIEDEEIDER